MEREKRTLYLTFGVSLLCHLIFFGLMLFWPSRSPAFRFITPPAIQIDIVSQPTPVVPPEPAPVETPQPPPAKIKPEIPEPEIVIPKKIEPEVKIEEPEKIPNKPPKHIKPKVKPKPDKLPSKIVSLTPEIKKSKPKPKIALKKKTQKSSNIIKQAIAKLETSKRKATYNPVQDKIERLRKKHGNIKNPEAPKKTEGTGGQSRGKFSLALAGQLNIYKFGPLADSITQNWAFNPGLAGGGVDLEVQILVKIMANGKIASMKYIKRSGNAMLDESAYRAIKKSDPLPRLPKGLLYYEIVMGFGPSGLN